MNFEILNKKKIVDGKMDLLSNYLKINYDKISIIDWIKIDESSIYMIDVICTVCYGSNEYIDKVLKFNRLSNGLDLKVGQIIALPDMMELHENSKYVDLDKAGNKNIKKNETLSNEVKNTLLNLPKSKGTLASGFNGYGNSYVRLNPSIKVTPSSNYIKKEKGVYVF